VKPWIESMVDEAKDGGIPMEGDAPDISAALMRGFRDAVEVGYRQGKQTVREIQKKISLADDWHDVLPAEALSWIQGYIPELARVYEADVLEQVRDKIAASLRAGKTEKHVARELRQIQGQVEKFSRHRLEAIARTESMRAYNMGHLRGMIDSQGVAGVEFSAILDDRTSPCCEAREGLRFPLGSPELAYNSPPLHPNCRSILIPVMDVEVPENWEGFVTKEALDDLPETVQRPGDIEVMQKVLAGASTTIQPESAIIDPDIARTFIPSIVDSNERAWAEQVFRDAPVEVRETILSLPSQPVIQNTTRGSCADPAGRWIRMESGLTEAGYKETLFHEAGHIVDALRRPANARAKVPLYSCSTGTPISEAIKKDKRLFQGRLTPKKTQKLIDMRDAVVDQNSKWHDHPTMSDLVCSMTKGKVSGGYGHTVSYYRNTGYANTEVFADLFSMKANCDSEAFEVARGLFPNTVKAFEDFLDKRGSP